MPNSFENYSVLMCVYAKENPTHFETAIDSVLNQTKPTNNFVIVCDGPLTEELDAVLERKKKENPVITVARLEKNSGVGPASQHGLSFITNEVFAKMDSDDVCDPTRMEKELSKINEGYDVVGAGIGEFKTDPTHIEEKRIPPQDHDKIVKFSKKRTPVNNVTIMYKKSQVLEAGGYMASNYLEDYTLDIKLIQQGRKLFNIQEVLVFVRCTDEQLKRRGNKKLRKQLKELRKMMLKTHYINRFQYHWYNFQGSLFVLSPYWLKRFLYKVFLRRK